MGEETKKEKMVPIFIGGAGRSGTTLLRVILDSHPNIACGPELKVTPCVAQIWREFQTSYRPALSRYNFAPEEINSIVGQVLLSLMQKYQTLTGKQRVADKSPDNVYHFVPLANMFPESPLIHVIRDGRDVVCSLLTMDWLNPITQKPVDYTSDARKASEKWVSAVEAARRSIKNPIVKKNYIEIRYEDLVNKPESTLKNLFEFIKEPWDSKVLDHQKYKHDLRGDSTPDQVSKPIYTSAVNRWKRELKPTDKKIVKEVTGALLIKLGYAKNHAW